MRAAGLANHLQSEYGIYLNGIIFVSPAIDYQTFIFDEDNQIPYFLFLPTYATTAWYHGNISPTRALKGSPNLPVNRYYNTLLSPPSLPQMFRS